MSDQPERKRVQHLGTTKQIVELVDVEHRDEFDVPLTEPEYREALQKLNYHGYDPARYGQGRILRGDACGYVWLWQHNRRDLWTSD